MKKPAGESNQGQFCIYCGAWYGELGLEPTPEQYVANMVAVFREVWRVLRPDGTLWLNMGDSYAGSHGTGGNPGDKQYTQLGSRSVKSRPDVPECLKPKDLCGIPWRVAFALQADGWWLRSDNPWIKNNPMPESADDRPNKCIEYMFLLTKSPHYYFDMDTVKIEGAQNKWGKYSNPKYSAGTEGMMQSTKELTKEEYMEKYQYRHWRNHDLFLKSIQHILDGEPTMLVDDNRPIATFANTKGYSGAHFATYPPALVEPCIKAGTSERGVCPECGAPWERVTEKGELAPDFVGAEKTSIGEKYSSDKQSGWSDDNFRPHHHYEKTTLGWRPTCDHSISNLRDIPPDPIPATVFDPFAGSGTTLQVARSLGRNGVGLDLSLEYLHLARQRLSLDALEAWGKAKKDGASVTDLPMFGGQDE